MKPIIFVLVLAWSFVGLGAVEITADDLTRPGSATASAPATRSEEPQSPDAAKQPTYVPGRWKPYHSVEENLPLAQKFAAWRAAIQAAAFQTFSVFEPTLYNKIPIKGVPRSDGLQTYSVGSGSNFLVIYEVGFGNKVEVELNEFAEGRIDIKTVKVFDQDAIQVATYVPEYYERQVQAERDSPEKIVDNGATYRGFQTETRGGRTC